MRLEMLAFTAPGAALCRRILASGAYEAAACAPARHAGDGVAALAEELAAWTAARFAPDTALVFVCAAGIAVRAIAPFVRGKDRDAAVLCIDEAGRYVIPLLSGHLGGANRLARELAALLGAEAVLTTATDVRGIFSPDAWAAENGCAVPAPGEIKAVAAALLDGEPVGLASEFPVEGLPAGVVLRADTRCGIEVALRPRRPFLQTLHILPRCIIAGIGCRRGVSAERIAARLGQALAEAGLPEQAVDCVASIDLKRDELGLLELCRRLRAPLRTFSAAELMAAEGEFTPSERVLAHTGADNVCERAAACAGGKLILPKTAADGVTIALAQAGFTVSFPQTSKPQ